MLNIKFTLISYPNFQKFSLGSNKYDLSYSLRGSWRSSSNFTKCVVLLSWEAVLTKDLFKSQGFDSNSLIDFWKIEDIKSESIFWKMKTFRKPLISLEYCNTTGNRSGEFIINWSVNFEFDLQLLWRLQLRPCMLKTNEIFRIGGYDT